MSRKARNEHRAALKAAWNSVTAEIVNSEQQRDQVGKADQRGRLLPSQELEAIPEAVVPLAVSRPDVMPPEREFRRLVKDGKLGQLPSLPRHARAIRVARHNRRL
jgi:hypothetical protein